MSAASAPILLFDVMGTLVRDPFFFDVPAFFGVSMEELLKDKDPNAWIEFERGDLNEKEFLTKFFRDRRRVDGASMKAMMVGGYAWLEGVEELLQDLSTAAIEMHAFSNYPVWYRLIENKLKLSRYMPWSFVSCHTRLRKPEPQAFLDAAKTLNRDPEDLFFIDDRRNNCEASAAVGMKAFHFRDAKTLRTQLMQLGIIS